MNQINNFSKSHLLLAAHCEFHWTTLIQIQRTTAAKLNVADLYSQYVAAVSLERKIVNRQRGLGLTKQIADADKLRDQCVSRLFNNVNMAVKSPLEGEKTQGELLDGIISPYRGIQANEKNKETSQIEGLLRDLSANNQTEAAMIALNLMPVYTALMNANHAFTKLMEDRVKFESKQHDPYLDGLSTSAQRRIVDELYDRMVAIINAYAIAAPNSDITGFVDTHNALVAEYVRTLSYLRPGGTGNEKNTQRLTRASDAMGKALAQLDIARARFAKAEERYDRARAEYEEIAGLFVAPRAAE